METKRVMIVEDEGVTALRLENTLTDMGYKVTSVEVSGESAVEKAGRDRPDLVLMDIILAGEMDGIEAAGRISTDYNIPIVFLTAHSDDRIVKKIKATDPFGYIIKPFDERELNVAIEIALYKHSIEQKLLISKMQFQALVESTSDWIWEVDQSAIYTYASPKVRDVLGYSPEEILGKTPFDLMPTGEAERISKIFIPIAAERKPLNAIENTNIHKKGHNVILETSGVPVFDSKGNYRGYRGIDRDITERKRNIGQIREQNQLLNTILESLTHPFYVINVNDYTIRMSNSAAKKNWIQGKSKCYELSHNQDSPCTSSDHPCIIEKITKTGGSVTVEHIHYDSHGKPRVVEVHGYPIFDENGNVTQVIEYNLDITDRKNMEKKLQTAAITDELTELFNRRGFFTLAEQQCKLSDRNKNAISLLYIDLDGMKNINDELGHKEGDRALKDTAAILRKTLREADIVARIGGDEFAVLLTDTTEPNIEKIIVGHIRDGLEIHNREANRKYELLLSIGISRYNPDKPCSIDDLLHHADTSMYEDKRMHKLEKELKPLIREEYVERRIYKRFRPADNCWAETDLTGEVKILDISLGGVRLLSSNPLSKDNIYMVRISPSNKEEISLSGKVAWTSLKSTAQGSDEFPYEAGLKFTELSDSLKSSLDKYSSKNSDD